MVDIAIADLGQDGFAGSIAVLLEWVEVLAEGTGKKEGVLGEECLLLVLVRCLVGMWEGGDGMFIEMMTYYARAESLSIDG
jgi:hypothetical protein